MTNPLKIIMIDNYDSFTYNLVNQFRLLGAEVIIYRNDTPVEEIFSSKQSIDPNNTVIVISPGPGNPDSAGNSLSIINTYAGKIPLLGICLGHQAIIQHFGGTIGQAKQIIHGKADDIYYQDNEILNILPCPFRAARYHSLVGSNIPDELEVIANTKDEVMAVKHKKHKILSFQFHPESILTTYGSQLLNASLAWLTNCNSNTYSTH
ncbi:aminodeoxychorismate/anthranilate synthase component II [Aliikangiella sp. IMCC44359]|uniref:aminodeoxychorismate/anthranilate synthase component II n=1 Tax=Aliikangiella sp. IMCC44359 TaxID=3459125 RepID=UPI00403AE965